jgi:long-chain acyl-CoA synthetase
VSGRFRWHPKARLFDSAGQAVPRARGNGAVLPDSPQGLAQALDLGAFRIGAADHPPPARHAQPVIETLTSGSTGQPRRILRSQASWTASFAVNAGFGIGPGAKVATLGRLIHSLSLYGAVEGLHLGAEVHLLEGLRPDRQRKALITRRISHLYATPAQLRLLVEGEGVCPDLQLVLVGGSKLDPTLRVAVAAMAPNARVREFYGAAETSFITLSDDDTPEGSVGRAYPGVEIRVDAGEVWVRSPYLFIGYASSTVAPHQPELPSPPGGEGQGEGNSATRWRDGWISVGEIGRMEAGNLYLSGRAGRMVTVADQNVFPEEIEGLLQALPGIRRAAVLPVPDPKRGQVLVALVQGDPDRQTEIMARLRAELGPLKAPKALIWLEDWPLLPSGKTDIKALEAHLPWPA